jgi:dCTP deaminase
LIWNDHKLELWAEGGGVEPYAAECVNPASIDLRLGDEWVDIKSGERYSRNSTPPRADITLYPGDTPRGEITLYPGMVILATTVEYIRMPPNATGVLYLKSSMARMGLDHSLAGFVDPGFHGELTMELHSHTVVKLLPGQRIAQLALSEMLETPKTLYNGRYQGQVGPTKMRAPKE